MTPRSFILRCGKLSYHIRDDEVTVDIINIAHGLARGIINVFEVFAYVGRVNELGSHCAVSLVEDKRRRAGVPHGS